MRVKTEKFRVESSGKTGILDITANVSQTVCDSGLTVTKYGLQKVGLLGTIFVMNQKFCRERLQKHFGIDPVVPAEDEQTTVHRIIYDGLCRGKIEDTSRSACPEIIQRVTGLGAKGIVLGCTELPLPIRPGDLAVPLFDTTRLHADAAVKLALSK